MIIGAMVFGVGFLCVVLLGVFLCGSERSEVPYCFGAAFLKRCDDWVFWSGVPLE